MEKYVEIKDIVEQEKHKRTLAKIKKREDTLDCGVKPKKKKILPS